MSILIAMSSSAKKGGSGHAAFLSYPIGQKLFSFHGVKYDQRYKTLAPAVVRFSNRNTGNNNIFAEDVNSSTASTPVSTTANFNTSATKITLADQKYMRMALEYAKIGKGCTYPNPAVGCVLVRTNLKDNQEFIVGTGFHPKAGMPHAEIFALLQASGYVKDGVEAAVSVMPSRTHSTRSNASNSSSDSIALQNQVQNLLEIYVDENGPQRLFENFLVVDPQQMTTAYVTLEPCCHTGKRTPPCAMSLVYAGVNRVVVGFRDPNPHVNGGGVTFLRSKHIQVDVLDCNECKVLVDNFVKRILQPKFVDFYNDTMRGAHRSALRSLAGRMKQENTLVELTLSGSHRKRTTNYNNDEASTDDTIGSITACWFEEVDTVLWDHELVLLRLGEVAKKKKIALAMAQQIAQHLNAHVAQVVGHTALLYRPGAPPILDLEQMIAN